MELEKVVLTISMDQNGAISVSGPIDNRVLCYGMLETAKNVIHERAQKAEQRILTAPANVLGMLDAAGKRP